MHFWEFASAPIIVFLDNTWVLLHRGRYFRLQLQSTCYQDGFIVDSGLLIAFVDNENNIKYPRCIILTFFSVWRICAETSLHLLHLFSRELCRVTPASPHLNLVLYPIKIVRQMFDCLIVDVKWSVIVGRKWVAGTACATWVSHCI